MPTVETAEQFGRITLLEPRADVLASGVISAAMDAQMEQRITRMVVGTGGGEVCVAAICPPDRVCDTDMAANWGKLRASVERMKASNGCGEDDSFDKGLEFAFRLVLDEMTTIELAELCPARSGPSWRHAALRSAIRSWAA